MTMNSSRPYIIRALYDWILENQCTPYILVDAFGEGVEVPQKAARSGGAGLRLNSQKKHVVSKYVFSRNRGAQNEGAAFSKGSAFI